MAELVGDREPPGRVLYTANGRGAVLDEVRFDEVIALVDKISLPPPLHRTSISQAGQPAAAAPGAPRSRQADILEALRKLGDLHTAGVLMDDECHAKKAELLRRV